MGVVKKTANLEKFPMARMFPPDALMRNWGEFWGPGTAWPVGALSRGAHGALRGQTKSSDQASSHEGAADFKNSPQYH